MTAEPSDLSLRRFRILRPHLEDGVPLATVARGSDTPLGSLRRWLRGYRENGMAGLERKRRSDANGHRSLPDLIGQLIEGLALEKPRRSLANIHRLAQEVAEREGVKAPSYAVVRSIVNNIDPALSSLAHQGPKSYSDTFDLVHRREAQGPNAVWQVDHTQLDVLAFDDQGAVVRPWLTIVIDDYSRAIASYRLFLIAPSALQTSLALRAALWRKAEPHWTICGIPEVLYIDNGSDFTSSHIERVCADLKIQMIFSLPGRPRGRGRIERFFSTINQRVLSNLPGYIGEGARRPKARLTLAQVQQAIGHFILKEYHHTPHSGTNVSPEARWSEAGFLPHMPESLEQLDLLLLTTTKTRKVHRDGLRLNGLRYIDPTFAAYVGESVMIRYDPADMAELRVYHNDQYLCRAICPELAGQSVSLSDIMQARQRRRRDLRATIKQRRSLVDALIGQDTPKPFMDDSPSPQTNKTATSSSHGLRKYAHD